MLTSLPRGSCRLPARAAPRRGSPSTRPGRRAAGARSRGQQMVPLFVTSPGAHRRSNRSRRTFRACVRGISSSCWSACVAKWSYWKLSHCSRAQTKGLAALSAAVMQKKKSLQHNAVLVSDPLAFLTPPAVHLIACIRALSKDAITPDLCRCRGVFLCPFTRIEYLGNFKANIFRP